MCNPLFYDTEIASYSLQIRVQHLYVKYNGFQVMHKEEFLKLTVKALHAFYERFYKDGDDLVAKCNLNQI